MNDPPRPLPKVYRDGYKMLQAPEVDGDTNSGAAAGFVTGDKGPRAAKVKSNRRPGDPGAADGAAAGGVTRAAKGAGSLVRNGGVGAGPAKGRIASRSVTGRSSRLGTTNTRATANRGKGPRRPIDTHTGVAGGVAGGRAASDGVGTGARGAGGGGSHGDDITPNAMATLIFDDDVRSKGVTATCVSPPGLPAPPAPPARLRRSRRPPRDSTTSSPPPLYHHLPQPSLITLTTL